MAILTFLKPFGKPYKSQPFSKFSGICITHLNKSLSLKKIIIKSTKVSNMLYHMVVNLSHLTNAFKFLTYD